MRTTIVLSALSETTMPRRTFWWPVFSGPSTTGCSVRGCSARRALRRCRYVRRCAALRRRSASRSSGVVARRAPRLATAAERRRCRRSLGVRFSAGVDSLAAAAVSATCSTASSGVPVVSGSSAIGLSGSGVLVEVEAALAGDRHGASEVALDGAEAGDVLQLAGGVLHAQAEEVTTRGRDVLFQLVVCEVAEVLGLHGST